MANLPSPGASFKAYQDYIRQMAIERGFSEHSVEQKFVKLVEELGELAQAAGKKAKLSVSQDHSNKIAEEAADVFIVFTDLCNKLGVDLESAIREKEVKNKSRTWK
jgi:NTP pyrophosphatase (non-canonical NTP hydrolase)